MLYERCFARFRGLTVRGVIWYQGESNGYFPEQYATLFPGLIADWRRFFGNGNLPASSSPNSLLPGSGRQERRPLGPPPPVAARQARTVPAQPWFVTADCGDAENIHPKNKYPCGYAVRRRG